METSHIHTQACTHTGWASKQLNVTGFLKKLHQSSYEKSDLIIMYVQLHKHAMV